MVVPRVIKLADSVDISKAENLLQEFRTVVEQGGDVTLNASEVKRIDTAGLQLLFSFGKTLQEQGGALLIEDPSEPFKTAARLVGFDKVLALQ